MGLGPALCVRFWGVRGSIACAGRSYDRYGGNTSCVEIFAHGERLIFDAGTGIRPLGDRINGHGRDPIDLFLSHTHIDHIVGLPFFAPVYNRERTIRIWSGHMSDAGGACRALETLMSPPIFPVDPKIFAATMEYRNFNAGETLTPHEGVTIRTGALNHPNGATGFRVEAGRRAVAYITDTEQRPGSGPDAGIVALCEKADLVIYDTSYTDAEYGEKAGWGHSTWREGIAIAQAAGARTLALFHHDPAHDDRAMDRILRDARREGRRMGVRVIAAREGLSLSYR